MLKKGISPVIATVLVMLITVVAASFIAPFAINFVTENLRESGDCFEVAREVAFADTEFNCYDAADDVTGFSLRRESYAVDAFRVSFTRAGSSTIVRIADGLSTSQARLLDGSQVAMPDVGGIRTYVIDGQYDSAEVIAVLEDGNTCSASDSIRFEPCTDPEAMALLQ